MNKFSLLGKIIILLLFVFLFTSIFLYIKLSRLENNNLITNEESLTVEEKISKIVVLPEGEEPTIFQITNIEQIKNEPFFTNAKLGDSVLVYTGVKKAFLYRESENKIVDIAPIILEEETDI